MDTGEKRTRRKGWLYVFGFIGLAFLLAVGYSLNDELQYQALIKEARSLGMSLTTAEINANIEKVASTDATPYRDLLAKFNTNPLLKSASAYKMPTVTPADVRKAAPWFFDDVADCVAEPRYDPTPFLSDKPKSLYREHSFISGVFRILTRDILADIEQNHLERARQTAKSLYGWLKFIDLDPMSGLIDGNNNRYQWFTAARRAFNKLPADGSQAKTLQEIAFNTPDSPPTRDAFMTWYHIPDGNPVDGAGETGDQYGQRMYTIYYKDHRFTSSIEAAANFPYFNFPGYERRSSKLQLGAFVAAIRSLPTDADDVTFAKAIDAEFSREAATHAPGTIELADVPGAFTNFANQRERVVKLRKSFSP